MKVDSFFVYFEPLSRYARSAFVVAVLVSLQLYGAPAYAFPDRAEAQKTAETLIDRVEQVTRGDQSKVIISEDELARRGTLNEMMAALAVQEDVLRLTSFTLDEFKLKGFAAPTEPITPISPITPRGEPVVLLLTDKPTDTQQLETKALKKRGRWSKVRSAYKTVRAVGQTGGRFVVAAIEGLHQKARQASSRIMATRPARGH